MTLPILTDGCVLPVAHQLIQILNDEFQKAHPTRTSSDDVDAITFNFRDSDYSPESGGYHPVEIRISRANSGFQLDYITDFSYVGAGWDTELAKEIDFDLIAGICEVRFYHPVAIAEAKDLFEMFQMNFLAYYQMDVFIVKVTVEDRG